MVSLGNKLGHGKLGSQGKGESQVYAHIITTGILIYYYNMGGITKPCTCRKENINSMWCTTIFFLSNQLIWAW